MDRKIKNMLNIVAVIVAAAAGIWGIGSLKNLDVQKRNLCC